MKAERLRTAGAPGKAPLPGWSNLTLSTVRMRNDRVAMHNILGVNSVDFQTCRLADPLTRPGVKRRSRRVWKSVLWRSERDLTTLVCRSLVPAIGKSRSRAGKLLTRIADPNKDCASPLDHLSSCITHSNLYRADRASTPQ